MSFKGRSIDDQEAASIVAGLYSSNGGNKRSRTSNSNGRNECGVANSDMKKQPKKNGKPPSFLARPRKDPPMDATALVFAQPELKPSPYFYYTDHSNEEDDDPLIPITVAGTVPTFPAKMHAILTNPALDDVVGWASHGRSWQIFNPRDFEIRVLPRYFEHSKLSSFVRQANGWGFRRVALGYGKNIYYHEYFLRAMPWLCKKMRRPKVAEKKAIDPNMEPDLDAISRERPVREGPPTREVLVVQRTIEHGPKARMPVMWDTGTPPPAPSAPSPAVAAVMNVSEAADSEKLSTSNCGESCGDLGPACLANNDLELAVCAPQLAAEPVATMEENMINDVGNSLLGNNLYQYSHNSVLSAPAGNQNNLNVSAAMPKKTDASAATATLPTAPPATTSVPSVKEALHTAMPTNSHSGMTSVLPNPPCDASNETPQMSADSHFVARFKAATAYHSNQICDVLSNAFVAGAPIPDETDNLAVPSVSTCVAAVTAGASDFGSTLDLLQRSGMAGRNNHLPSSRLHHQPMDTAVVPTASVVERASATAHMANLENVFDLLQRARMADPRHTHHVAAAGGLPGPDYAGVASTVADSSCLGFNSGTINATNNEHPIATSLREQAAQRLQQFQAYQAAMGDDPQLPFPSRTF